MFFRIVRRIIKVARQGIISPASHPAPERSATRGFTLLELMLVLAIIMLLAAILIPNLIRLRMTAQDVAMEAEMQSIYKAMLVFYALNGRFPRGYNELRPYIEVPGFDAKYQLNPNPLGQ